MIIEIVDKERRINEILPTLDEMVSEGMVTLERVHIIAYRSKSFPA